jgi:pimeloyl-ACP methyl ester carboxylesterase
MVEAEPRIAAIAAGSVEYAQLGAGPAVLWLHGTPGGHDQAAFVAADLAERGFTLVCPSRPGYLGTDLAVGRTPAEQADAMAAMLTALDIPRAAVVATSGGGPVGLHVAARHPDRVWALVLVSAVSSPEMPRGSGWARRLAFTRLGIWLLARMHRKSPTATARALLSQQGNFTDAELLDAVAAVEADPKKRQFVAGLIATMRPFGPRIPGLRNDFRNNTRIGTVPADGLHCPVLIIHGEADAQVPFTQAESLAAAVPGASLIAIPGGAHLLPLSRHAARMDQAITDFLRQYAPES